MNWEKQGRVYVADGEADWMQSHAYVPTPYRLDGETLRVYVAFLDDDRFGRVGYVDVDPDDPTEVRAVSEEPVFDVGAPGTFDHHGVTPTSVVETDEELRLYYFGWQRGVSVRYFLFAGVAVSNDGGNSFERYSETPILDRVDGERFVRSAPYVRQDGDKFEMWYVSGDEWITVGDKEVPTYNLRYTTSPDGLDWGRCNGEICLRLGLEDEIGFGRPFVRKDGDRYRMWYSVRTRSKGYRIGYAESVDGRTWERRDSEAGVDVSDSGWDDEMICFPNVVETETGTYLFHNGNGFGETGFGVAKLEETG